MNSAGGVFASFLSGISTLLALAVEVGLLVIALTIVKPKRADAAMPLAIGAIAHMASTVAWPILTSFIVPALAGGDNPMMIYQVFSLLFSLLRTGGWVAILFGIVKLASPAPLGGVRSPWG